MKKLLFSLLVTGLITTASAQKTINDQMQKKEMYQVFMPSK
jgi:hypothetical protein